MQRGRKSGGEAPSRERGAEAQVRGPARRTRLPARARPFGSVPSGSWRPGCACLQPPSGRGQSPLFGGQVWLPSLNCRADARVARVTASQLPVPSELSVWAVPSKVALLRARGPVPLRPPSVVPARPCPRQALPPAPSPPPPLQCLPPSRPRPASAPQCARHTAATPQGPRGPARAGGAAGAAVRAAPSPRCVQPPCSPLPLRPNVTPRGGAQGPAWARTGAGWRWLGRKCRDPLGAAHVE